MNTLKLSVYAFCITSTFALMGCGKILDKLKGVSDDAGSDAATVDETVDAAPADTGDAAADAAVAVVLPVGDRIPTFTAEENLAQKEINAQNYKTQLSDLDQQVKALK
ncbi:MAG: hypothetical protein ACRELY_09210 [Polyangiaceae bacterium]